MGHLQEQLEQWFEGRVCLMGLGNTECGDDGLGVLLARMVAARLKDAGESAGAPTVLVAGTMPERFLGAVAENRFDSLVFVDAVEVGRAPGSVVLLSGGQMVARFPQISTHKMSLGTLARWVEANGAMRVGLLGVQPGSLKRAEGLSAPVERTLEILCDLICNLQRKAKVAGCQRRPSSRTGAEEDSC